jgi:hypothetical protein
MSGIHDVLRYLIRSNGHASGAAEQDLLLTVDADEQGYESLDAYKDKLAQDAREAKAAAQAAAGPQGLADSTAGLSDAQLEAELARRQALAAARQNSPTVAPALPIPTTGPAPSTVPPATP